MSATLCGVAGELVLVRIHVESRRLEDLLDSLAGLSFPVNPEIYHGSPTTAVEFPAYSSQLMEVNGAVGPCQPAEMEIVDMLSAIQSR